MNNKRMRFGFLVLSLYAALGLIGVASRGPQGPSMELADLAKAAATSARATEAGSADPSVEWHSFLPGAFK